MLVLVTSGEARSSYMISKDAKSWVKSMIVKVVVKIGEASWSVQEGLEELAKRQKIGEASGSVQEQSDEEPKADELSQEQLQQLMIIVLEKGMNVEALQTKYPIIDWEVYSENTIKDDLVKLWSLVHERFNSTELTDDKAKELCVELKRLFKPVENDTLWKIQRYMHDPLTWKLYDTCGVHHVSTERGHDIFMLVEKDYPLTRALMNLILCNKLRVDEYSEMANELLRKIFILANRPRQRKQDRRNEIKARGTLLMALPNKDQLKFHSYKMQNYSWKPLRRDMEETRNPRNGDSRRRFFHQEDMKLKLLRSLPSEWKTHALIWRNKEEIETISLDDLYNNVKIYEPELTGSSKDLEQTDPDDLEEMDLQWEMAMLTIRTRRFIKRTSRKLDVTVKAWILTMSKVECYNCHKNGHFAKEWGEMELSSSSSDSEVDSCSKSRVKAYATLKEQYDSLSSNYKKSQFNLVSYKAGLESVETRLAQYKKNEAVFEEKINVLNLEVRLRDNALVENKKKLEKAEKERDELKLKLEKFQNSSKCLNNLLESQVSDKVKTGLGYNAASHGIESFVNTSEMLKYQEHDKSKSDKGYHAVPPPYTGNFIPSKPDLMFMDEIVESENMDVITVVTPSNNKTVENKGVPNIVETDTVRKNNFSSPIVEN
ncbi:hypothetical protein Tco_0268605 [Tanacetum coccineum]